MKITLATALFLMSIYIQAQEKFPFNLYFNDQTLRIDYFHTGDAKTEEITMDKMYVEGIWAGNPDHCIQPFELGTYQVKVEDEKSKKLIFTKGYNTIFAEYQTIDDAIRGIKRTFHESVLIPLPKRSFVFTLEKRDRYNKLAPIYSRVIDPHDYHIIKQIPGSKTDKIIRTANNGNPHEKVDVVILAEGYQADEADKFKIDMENYSRLFFSVEPYKSHSKRFNISGVFRASAESGTDEPRQYIYKNTVLGTSFNALDLDRYCLSDDNRIIRNVASNVPYDVIVIMINLPRYGGGGIYNWQTVFTARSPHSEYVFLHEFGHGFAGLADEYFSSQVSYVDFYTEGVEPLEANITALPDKDNVKWAKYLSPGIDVPTDWGKATYDSLLAARDAAYSEGEKVLSELRKSGASLEKLGEARNEIRKNVDVISLKIDDFYRNHPLRDKVGVFEGANYMSKGMYRPTLMSLMHGYEDKLSYDIVNEQAIISMIEYFSGTK